MWAPERCEECGITLGIEEAWEYDGLCSPCHTNIIDMIASIEDVELDEEYDDEDNRES